MNQPVNVLLVDDEPRNLEVLEGVLQSPELRLVRASSAEETLLALLNQDFAVIVLDIQMPGMSGIELAHLIKQREKTQHIPIIFLTAFYQDERRMLESYNVGAVDYLTKPANPQVLRSKVAVFVDLFRKTRALEKTNAALEQEIVQRQNAERALRESNDALEVRVEARTAALSTHARRSSLLSDLATELLKTGNPRDVFETIFSMIARDVRAEGYCQHLVDADGARLTLATSGGTMPDGRELPAEIAIDPEASFEAIQRKLAPLIHCQPDGIYPLLAGGELLGTFSIVMPAQYPAGEAEHRFVRIACDLVAAGLERARLEGELRAARDMAERAGRTKDEFLAALSHELRTPLNPVLLLASEAAANPAFSDDVRAHFTSIRKNVELEARLIDDLLDLTRITRGKLMLDIRPLDLHGIVQDAVATVRSEIDNKNIVLRCEFNARRSLVAADGVRLQQVFWNVLKNAVKFTPEGGFVVVATQDSPEKNTVTVAISDTGIGLTKTEIDRIFEAFTQGDHAGASGSHRFGGLGLGLTISRSLLENHNGTITVKSAGLGEGATFLIELPLASEETKDTTSADISTEESKEAVETAPRLKKVLLVEDHEPTRKALEILLQRRRFEVSTADSLEEARALAASRPFDVLISDIGLPDGTGFELMNEMRELYGMSGIALTGYGMEEDIDRSRDAGFHAHLTKPILIQSLDKALADLLGEN